MLPIAEKLLRAQAKTGLEDRPSKWEFPHLTLQCLVNTLGRWLNELWLTQWTAKYGHIFISVPAGRAILAAPYSLVVKALMCDRQVQILLWIIWNREIHLPLPTVALIPVLLVWMNRLKISSAEHLAPRGKAGILPQMKQKQGTELEFPAAQD